MSNEELVKLIQENILDTGYINDAEHMQELYINNLPIIRKMAVKYNAYAELEDLVQEGYFGLYEAVRHYESGKEIKFITYAVYWIKQAMQRYIENCGRAIRIPVHLMADIMKYKKFLELYGEEYNSSPNGSELCRYLKCTPKKLEHLRKACQQYNIKSLDAELANDNGECSTLGENCAGSEDVENDVIEHEMNTQIRNNLWQIVQNSLTEQENKVITERYRNSKTRQEIAEIASMEVASVRSLEERAMRKLRVPRIKRMLAERFDIAMTKAYKSGIICDNVHYTSTERAAFKDMGIRI